MEEKKKQKLKRIIILGILGIILITAGITINLFLKSKNNVSQEVLTYLVQFESAGGEPIEAQLVNPGEYVIKPKDPKKEGFDFNNWYYQGQVYDFNTAVNEDKIIEAKWIPKEGIAICKVSFDSNGGSTIETIQVAKGNTMSIPIAPVKEGYIFKGWFIGEEKFDITMKINKDIHLTARWLKQTEKKDEKKTNQFQENADLKNNQNGSITTSSDEISNQSSKNEIDDVVYDYSGRWYLNGYSDIYITVERIKYSDDTVMEIIGENICFSHYETYHLLQPTNPGSCGMSTSIKYTNFKSDLDKAGINLSRESININKNGKNYTFVKSRGMKDKYDYFNTMYKSALGTWYLYNHPDSSIRIYTASKATSVANADFYGIDTSDFSLTTFETNTSTTWGGELGTSDALFKEYGITVSGDTLTISNGKGTRKFYKTKKTVAVENVELNKSKLQMKIGDTEILSATINPKDSYDKKVTWSSSNTKVVTVDSKGKITAKAEGTANITVTTNNGKYTASCNVEVEAVKTTGIKLNHTAITIIPKETSILTAIVNPSNATNKTVTWSSSNAAVATVDNTGKVTAKTEGTAIITVTTENGSYTAKCTVTVAYPKLEASGTIALSTKVTSSGAISGINVKAKGIGGNEKYSYKIRLYYNNSLVQESNSRELFYGQKEKGEYRAEIIIRDSNGNEAMITKKMTLS